MALTPYEIYKDVEKKIGKTVQTIWGPSLVVGFIKDYDLDMVELQDYGDDDHHYFINLCEWPEALM
ncbi:hypothetical protein AWM68_17340 [Fictibacillus phosphorivorans]|uniref:Uncharacterized protein n=1 Tax=Fictibacillus phosphorivorans TaxID=1221500 RepID=A0A163S157_9BACL|nr:hypothetical protein [Fictibacillus phosphorivorans]KZE67937.1 hypothetical protein AWM68_17340 [Fictibacillus phosphorivorans]